MEQLIAKFKDTETKYNELRAKLGRGEISGQQLKEELKRLMVQDQNGKYWMLGGKSGKWYIHDGKQWLESDPYEQFQPQTAEPEEPEIPILSQDYQLHEEQEEEQEGEQVINLEQNTYQQEQEEQALQLDQESYLQQEKDKKEDLSFEYTQHPQADQEAQQALDTQPGDRHAFSNETATLDGYSDETRMVDSTSYQDQQDFFSEDAQSGTQQAFVVEENAVTESPSFADSSQQQEESPSDDPGYYEASKSKDRYQQYADMLGYDDTNSDKAAVSDTFAAKEEESPLFSDSDLAADSTETPLAEDYAAVTKSEPLQTDGTSEDTSAFSDSRAETQLELEPKAEPVAAAPDARTHPSGKVDLDYITCKTCRSRIPPYANFCTFCGATLAQQKGIGKAKGDEPEAELLLKSVKLTSLMFFLGGLGLIVGVILGATFGIFKDFLIGLSNYLPMMLQETRGGIAGGMIFAAIGGIAGFIASAILAILLGGIYNLISFIFGGLRFKTKQ
jgi:hypothetical protein